MTLLECSPKMEKARVHPKRFSDDFLSGEFSILQSHFAFKKNFFTRTWMKGQLTLTFDRVQISGEEKKVIFSKFIVPVKFLFCLQSVSRSI